MIWARSSVKRNNHAGLLALLFLLPMSAQAGCHVNASSLNFGRYDVFDPVMRSSAATLSVWCDSGLRGPQMPVSIGIGPSAGSGLIVPRQMRRLGGGDRLHYNLFVDPALTTPWGDGTSAAAVQLAHVAPESNVPLTIYAAIFPGQDVSVGSYSDSVSITITP